jgi:hypothetical protein
VPAQAEIYQFMIEIFQCRQTRVKRAAVVLGMAVTTPFNIIEPPVISFAACNLISNGGMAGKAKGSLRDFQRGVAPTALLLKVCMGGKTAQIDPFHTNGAQITRAESPSTVLPDRNTQPQ